MMAYLDLPLWAQYLLQGIMIFVAMAAGAVTLTRTGRSPWLAFLLIVPLVQIAALWALAFLPWRGKDG